MKNKLVRTIVGFWISSLSFIALNVTAQTLPTILTHPTNQVASYGANVTFTVVPSGSELTYQWQKDGVDLTDYANIAGSQTTALQLVGVGQRDAANYTVAIRNAGGSITSSVARLTVNTIVVFSDSFEANGLTNWTTLRGKEGVSLDARNHTTNGSHSVLLTNATQRIYHNLGMELAGLSRVTFWTYENSTTNQLQWNGEVRGYKGKGVMPYAGGGFQQVLAIGSFYGPDYATNNKGSLAGEILDPTKYQGRVWRGTNRGWFNLNDPGAPNRTPGWHKLEIERLADNRTVRFKVDGVVGRTVTGIDDYTLDSVMIAGAERAPGKGAVWFDDIKVEGYPQRFDWESKDSDGKGLFDWMKLRETGTNSTITDISQRNTVFELPASAASQTSGNWASETAGIYAVDRRGYVEYVLNAPSDDSYRVEIEGRERNHKMPVTDLPLIISIDGENLGRFSLNYDAQTNGFVRCFTPFIKTGPHTVRIYWDNAESRCSLYLQSIRLQSLLGPDLNNNGIKDWVENRLINQSGMEVASSSSAVSPICIEGRGQYLSMMKFLAGTAQPLTSLPIRPGAGNHWYCNVPLSSEAPTTIVVSHQNGGLEESMEINWEETNLLQANDVAIRKGDSLLLTAVPTGQVSGTVQIKVGNLTNYITDVAYPVAHRFDQAGTFVVTGRFDPTGVTRSINVKVVEASFDGYVAAWVNHKRSLTFTNFSPAVTFEVDPRLKPIRGTNAGQFSITNDSSETRVILARLGVKGPVLASLPVKGFRLFNSAETYVSLIQVYGDGSQLVEAACVLSPVLPDLNVEIQLHTSGVTFDDGTVSKTLTSADFDAFGIGRVRIIRAAGVKTSFCHTVRAYQNGEAQ